MSKTKWEYPIESPKGKINQSSSGIKMFIFAKQRAEKIWDILTSGIPGEKCR